MRKSIFDLVADKLDMEGDTYRLVTMAKGERTLCTNRHTYYSVFKFVDEFCFRDWKYRSHYINVDDFLEALDLEELVKYAKWDIEAHLTLIELIYNFWNLAHNMFEDEDFKENLQWCGNFYHLKDVMDEILEEYNHIVYTTEDKDYFIVVENKAEVTAAAEIMPTAELSFDVIKYNHRSLKGEVDAKRAILVSLGAELEPKRKVLQGINKQLSEDIFFMLNNMNVRHNNCAASDPGKYKEYVSKMTPEQLEEWYDELYQMMLLAVLLLDNVERSAKVCGLKANVTGGK
ncbi:hypothetical protein [Anaerotignum faecicola]